MPERIRRHPSVSKEAKKHLLRVCEFIEAHPKAFDMADWVQPPPKGKRKADYPCGTVACLAGFIVTLKHDLHDVCNMEDGELNSILGNSFHRIGFPTAARDIADLTYEQGNNLFFVSGWPEPFYSDHERARSKHAKALVAVQRVKYFIRTGK